MSPTFQHIDALIDHEKTSAKSLLSGDGLPASAEARAVNATVKSADDEELDIASHAQMLRQIEEETWQNLEWVDESVSIHFPLLQGLTDSIRTRDPGRCTTRSFSVKIKGTMSS